MWRYPNAQIVLSENPRVIEYYSPKELEVERKANIGIARAFCSAFTTNRNSCML